MKVNILKRSESKSYYPGELQKSELLHSSTHSEGTDRKSTFLKNEEVHNVLRSQQ